MKSARPFASPRSFSLRSAGLRSAAFAGVATLVATGLTACKSNSSPAPIITNNAAADPNGPDPAAANMAGASSGSSSGQPTQVMGQSQSYTPQQQGESYPSGQQAPAPVVQGYPQQSYSQQGYDNGANGYAQGYTDGEAAEATTAPPPLPQYDQPPAPDPNDIWTPGYWNYADTGYYWVPGTWVAAPYYGALWTPPYWGYYGNRYRFHHGYWGPHIGYYGGIDYGFGYVGIGYYGGYWRGHDFFYNRAVNRVGPGFGNVYERPVVVNNIRYNMQPTVRVSFNGGPGGINAQPRPFELAAAREQHVGPVPAQVALREQAATNRGNFFAANQGRPAQVALAHPPEARGALPANNPGQPFNRPGGPTAQPFNRPGGPTAQPFNRPGEPVNRPGAPAAANQPFNRPAEPANRPGAPAAGNQPFNRPGAPAANQPFNHPGAPAAGNQPFNRPGEPANHPGNAPGANHAPAAGIAPSANRPVPAQPRTNAAGNPGFNRPTPQTNPGVNRPAPAPAPHVEAARPTPSPAPQPHVEAARPAPAPHVEAPHPAPAPAPHPGPAPAAPHPGPAPAPHAEGGHPR